MRRFQQLWPFAVGLTVWGTSLALLVHGLVTGAWYGYVYLAIFVGFGVFLKVLLYRIQKSVEAEFWRDFFDRNSGAGNASGSDV